MEFEDLIWSNGLLCGSYADKFGNEENTLKIVQFILPIIKEHMTPENYVGELNRTLCVHCEMYADIHVVRLLLENGANSFERAINNAIDSKQKEIEMLLWEFLYNNILLHKNFRNCVDILNISTDVKELVLKFY